MMRRRLGPAVLTVAMTLITVTGAATGPAAAQARPHAAQARAHAAPDSVLAWNAIAVDTALAAKSFQVEGIIRIASVQAAVYDSLVAIEGGYRPYTGHLRAPRDASVDAAVATAAHDTLVVRFPSQVSSVDGQYATSLAAIPEGPAKTDGIHVGARAAADVLAARAGDGLGADVPYTFGSGPGAWILPTDNTNPAMQTPQTPWVAVMRPFLIHRADQFRPGPPPPLSSALYARDLNETETYGAVNSPARTSAQTDTALFWNANGVQFDNATIRDITTAQHLDAVTTARDLALGELVSADAGIACFDAKYHYSLWRPYTAIHGAGDDGNPATTPDPTWSPLLPTPNHPEYPAAHTCVSAAQAVVYTALLHTTRINLTLTSPATGTTHHYDTAADLINEVIDARVWGGLHYRNSGQVGARLGIQVAVAALLVAPGPEQHHD
jgi:hypothetical protein